MALMQGDLEKRRGDAEPVGSGAWVLGATGRSLQGPEGSLAAKGVLARLMHLHFLIYYA